MHQIGPLRHDIYGLKSLTQYSKNSVLCQPDKQTEVSFQSVMKAPVSDALALRDLSSAYKPISDYSVTCFNRPYACLLRFFTLKPDFQGGNCYS